MQTKTRQFMIHLLLLIVVALPTAMPGIALAQTEDELATTIDEMLTDLYKPNEPGAAVIVVRDGQVLFRKGYGMANLELSVPIAPEMVFRLGSITKQFTAVAILMLAEEGKLALDDEISKFLPDFPTHNQKITVEHLLTHTSGIRNYTDMVEWLPLWRKDLRLSELIDLFKDERLDFTPGTEWAYSNSGYVLLGAIIEKAAKMSYERFIETHIFKALGMDHSFYDNTAQVIPGRVAGYTLNVTQNAPYLSMTHPHAAGALVSSVDDLAIWDAALYTDKLVKQSTLQRAFASYKLNNGTLTDYGYGWGLTSYEGHPMFEHGGGIHGFSTYAIRMPEDKVFVAILTNTDSAEMQPDAPAFKIAALVSGKPYVEPVAITLPPAELDALAGSYQLEDQSPFRVTRIGDYLIIRDQRIFSASATEFFIPNTFERWRFIKNADGIVTELGMQYRGGPVLVAKKIEPAAP
jgi:D-alanyl-D-alanine carboxypeptidase